MNKNKEWGGLEGKWGRPSVYNYKILVICFIQRVYRSSPLKGKFHIRSYCSVSTRTHSLAIFRNLTYAGERLLLIPLEYHHVVRLQAFPTTLKVLASFLLTFVTGSHLYVTPLILICISHIYISLAYYIK